MTKQTLIESKRTGKRTRATILRSRADALEVVAACDRELAELEAHAETTAPPAGYIDQTTSPLGRRKHLAACRDGLAHKSLGKQRLVRVEDLEQWIANQHRPKQPPSPATNLAQVFDVRRCGS